MRLRGGGREGKRGKEGRERRKRGGREGQETEQGRGGKGNQEDGGWENETNRSYMRLGYMYLRDVCDEAACVKHPAGEVFDDSLLLLRELVWLHNKE